MSASRPARKTAAQRRRLLAHWRAVRRHSRAAVAAFKKHRRRGLARGEAIRAARKELGRGLPRGGWKSIEGFLIRRAEPEAERLASHVFFDLFNLDPDSLK